MKINVVPQNILTYKKVRMNSKMFSNKVISRTHEKCSKSSAGHAKLTSFLLTITWNQNKFQEKMKYFFLVEINV